MKKDEINEIRWSQYQIDAPVNENLFEEALDIFDNIESRGAQTDLVNWDERAEMDAATKRNGSKLFEESEITDSDRAEMGSIKKTIVNKPATPEQLEKQELNEQAPEEQSQSVEEDGTEIDLLAYGADLIDFMENNDV
jgi:hypothetical protein